MYFDKERIQLSLEQEPVEIPHGLTFQGMDKFISSNGKCELKNSDFHLTYSVHGMLLYMYFSDPVSEHLRFGQWFCNIYIEKPWPELYYERDEKVARKMIEQWLDDHQYVSNVPEKVN